MVAVEPDLCQVGEAVILGHLLRGQVAVVVDDGQVAGVIVVEPAGRLALEEEIVGDERVGQGVTPFFGRRSVGKTLSLSLRERVGAREKF